MNENKDIKRNNSSLLQKKEELERLSFPIGKFYFDPNIDITQHIEILASFPQKLKDITAKFSEKDFEKTYRVDGWTARQVIHHIADSHANAYIRLKLALTEEKPTIKPYQEDKWAEQIDYQKTPITMPLAMIEILHFRMVILFENMTKKDFERTYFHPEHQKSFSLHYLVAMYAWHSMHHLGHLASIKLR